MGEKLIGSDGATPNARLIADSNGNLYGTTNQGGGTGCFPRSGFGVVFKLSPSGMSYSYAVLHTFTGGSDGGLPYAGLIVDSSGNLYGTTGGGGSSGCSGLGCGVVFKLSPSGTSYSYAVLYPFTGGLSDGGDPEAGLIVDSDGNLYGTTAGGGASGVGTVFKLSPGGTETLLHTFSSSPSDGQNSHGDLIADGSGNLYGTTLSGGASGGGEVFELLASVPFTDFSGKLEIAFGQTPNTDSFQLNASFTLGSASTGTNPVTDPVTLSVGTFSTTIPPGSFKGTGAGPFTFQGTINGVALQVRINLKNSSTRQYSLQAQASSASLTGTPDPAQVTLTVGNNSGTTSISY